jgi:hypothetical protein
VTTPEGYRRATEVFLSACSRTEDRRPAYLDLACAGDPELRGEVESLLKFHRAGEEAPARPPLSPKEN